MVEGCACARHHPCLTASAPHQHLKLPRWDCSFCGPQSHHRLAAASPGRLRRCPGSDRALGAPRVGSLRVHHHGVAPVATGRNGSPSAPAPASAAHTHESYGGSCPAAAGAGWAGGHQGAAVRSEAKKGRERGGGGDSAHSRPAEELRGVGQPAAGDMPTGQATTPLSTQMPCCTGAHNSA